MSVPTFTIRYVNYFSHDLFQPTEELFYQVKGTMYLRILEDGEFKCIEIKEGEIFMLPCTWIPLLMLTPAYTMHSPYRLPGTIGVVLERTRELPGTYASFVC